ncbi:class I SAM-dependent methyltransferase [Methanosphaerula palustris]|uniref:Methyltransferase type 11 n=1 Tax=Methanosphaerula palustris (strain ATCC BAA-1556 / DSM 19958 / E1-9c) TaxID=521011 RepID=B8GI44_METPE|nr:class I SAM-dependent methyltransferase [Methanosphaerula palustris]ACL16784.1 Methyltransferase type 11 [Methanosphaerula palustris E1-9c]
MQDLPSSFRELSFRDGFRKIYDSATPWDIGRPKAPFIAVADRITGPILDAGCGTGDTTLYFTARGREVTGIDFVKEAIRRAKAKAAERGLSAEFLVKDAMTLVEWDRRFMSVIDSGLFHVYEDQKDHRGRYVSGLAHVLMPGGRLYLYGFSDETPSAPGGGISRQDLENAFSDGWEIESVQTVAGEINPAFAAEHPEEYPDGKPKMIFAIIRRKE